MLKIKTEFKLSQIKQIQETVGSKKIRSVANKAINKTVDKAQRFIAKEIINKQGLAVSQAAVSRSQDKKKSTVKSLGAVVIIRKKNRIPLKEFGARQNASGVSYKIRKQSGRKLIPGGFIVKSYGKNVYRRPTKLRPTGSRKYGPSIWGFFLGQKLTSPVKKYIRTQLQKEIVRELREIRIKKLKKSGTI